MFSVNTYTHSLYLTQRCIYACSALFAYNNAFNVSYNPVSRQDSERQSCSDSERNSK